MHILAAVLLMLGALALIFGSYITFVVGGAEEDVSGGTAFIGGASALIGIILVVVGVALRAHG